MFHQIVAHGTKAIGSPLGKQGDRSQIAVHTFSYEVIGAIITDLQNDIGDNLGQIHEL